jgi:hypothetical protein
MELLMHRYVFVAGLAFDAFSLGFLDNESKYAR